MSVCVCVCVTERVASELSTWGGVELGLKLPLARNNCSVVYVWTSFGMRGGSVVNRDYTFKVTVENPPVTGFYIQGLL